MADDVLAALSPKDVAAFYRRLADAVEAKRGALDVSLAAIMMRMWLDNRKAGAELSLDAPAHLQRHEQTLATQLYHRKVFLTEQRARSGGADVWAGILPRLKGSPPHKQWDLKQPLTMEYESLTEFPLRYQLTGDDADRDLLYSLHGFQLHSKVLVSGTQLPVQPPSKGPARVRVTFQSFECYAADTYDWDYSEHLTVPNPDFQSRTAGAVSPKSDRIVVYHSNAKRIEDAGLAAPYRFKTKPWRVTTAALLQPADVDPARKL